MTLPATAILTCDQMARCDRWTIQSGLFTGYQLMRNAGAAIADVVLREFSHCTSVDVLCGPGNNGGDGYVVASLLHERGLGVRIYALGAPKPNTDAAIAAQAWARPVEQLDAYRPRAGSLVIDALFGAGFRGSLPDAASKALQAAQAADIPILAVDLPSGIDGDTGLSDWAPDCVSTVTFYRPKPAHCLQPSAIQCGTIHVADIGVHADPAIAPQLHVNHRDLWQQLLPDPRPDTHKYSRGHIAVFSGPRHKTGAARLSAMAAARAGAGAVTLIGTPGALDIHAAHLTSIMLKSCEPKARVTALEELTRPAAAMIGPGFGTGPETSGTVCDLLERASILDLKTVVLDADAFTTFEPEPSPLFDAIKACGCSVIMTPHAGEFARLFPTTAGNKSLGKLQQAKAAAGQSGAIVVFKGPDTVIAAPDGRAAINTNANAALATAGSGDVLAGLIASLTGQAMPAFKAACAGVWIHAEAGRKAGPMCIAEDFVSCIPKVFEQVKIG